MAALYGFFIISLHFEYENRENYTLQSYAEVVKCCQTSRNVTGISYIVTFFPQFDLELLAFDYKSI